MTSKAPSEVSKLFKAAKALDNEVDAAKDTLEKALEKRSGAIRKIVEATGGNKGPFNDHGKMVMIRSRKVKAKDADGNDVTDKDGNQVYTGEETYYFVDMGNQDVVVIE